MVIDTMFVYLFAGPDLGVELFFEKEKPTEGEGANVKVGS